MIALKTLLFILVGPGTATVIVPYLVLRSAGAPSLELGALRWLGLPPMVLGALGFLWCAWDFTFTGRGTPAPIDPPKELVAKGLYRFVRNPMYVSVLSVLLGEFALFESTGLLVYAITLFVAFHLFVLFYEEPTLRRKFGKSYEDYCVAVPRWIPKPRISA